MQQAAPERGEVAGQQAVDDEEAGTGRWRVNEQIDPAATGEPAKLVVAETDHYQSEPEDWDRPSDQREKANDEVGKAAAKDGRPHAGGYSHSDRREQSGEGKLERRWERIGEVVGDCPPRADAPPEIAVQEAAHVGEVLLRQRTIEVVFGPECRDLVGSRVVAKRGHRGVRRDHVRNRERDNRHADHHRDDPDHATREEAEEPHGAPAPYLLIEAKSVQSIGLQTNPFTLERRPKGSVG